MTNADKRQEERRLDDERCVDGLLAEVGCPDDAELRTLLLEMRNLRVTEIPQPSAELAALLDRPGTANVTRLEVWSRKHARKNRGVFTTLAVAASLGVAGGAAAGNDTLRSLAQETVSSIIGAFLRPAPPTPNPTSPAPPSPASPTPAQVPGPAPAAVFPSPAGTLPAGRVPVAPDSRSGSEPSTGERQENSPAPGRGQQVAEDVETGPPSEVPQTGGEPAGSGASGATDVPPPANDRPPGGTEAPDDGDAKGKARSEAETGQGAAQPTLLPRAQGGR
ncbi:hypothetical protein FCN77_05360 [Arthrobacter sp. 24S4-2]|uniref:hypothetical protein n=1 Tax=Arthrobacter sp. 24S4-2 TaxID=2575374 RepID=UPI0010C7B97C|nr:hypothetical protein [Arthrobacter sp. 24S4-2]QCO97251.1 hypothetical protein FCN77_05360 [Arthrobacter sp. 24S4-2]